jgi:hypothetical protein
MNGEIDEAKFIRVLARSELSASGDREEGVHL